MIKKLAFVIEDDFDGSMVFSKALEANGLKTEQIMEGNKALERLAAAVPALVVLDLHLPNVPGPEILKQIRADTRLKGTLVVVVTADPRMAELIKEDADLVLLKPTTFSQVRDLVGRLLAVRARAAKAAAAPPVPPTPAPEPALHEPAPPGPKSQDPAPPESIPTTPSTTPSTTSSV